MRYESRNDINGFRNLDIHAKEVMNYVFAALNASKLEHRFIGTQRPYTSPGQ